MLINLIKLPAKITFQNSYKKGKRKDFFITFIQFPTFISLFRLPQCWWTSLNGRTQLAWCHSLKDIQALMLHLFAQKKIATVCFLYIECQFLWHFFEESKWRILQNYFITRVSAGIELESSLETNNKEKFYLWASSHGKNTDLSTTKILSDLNRSCFIFLPILV